MLATTPAPTQVQTPDQVIQKVQTPAQVLLKKLGMFQLVSAAREERYLKFMVYGDFGVGKTYLAATAQDVPEMRNVLFIDAEAGDLTISWRDDIRVARVADFTALARIHDMFLVKHCSIRDKMAPGPERDKRIMELEQQFSEEEITEPRYYNTVVLDSLTEIQKYCMYQILGITADTTMDTDWVSAQIQDWGKLLEKMRLLVRSFRNLNMHVIFVAQLDEEQDHLKQYHRKPLFDGKLAKEITGFVDYLGYYVSFPDEKGETTRRLYVTPGKTYKAKNRFRSFTGSYIENPTMHEIIQLSGLQRT